MAAGISFVLWDFFVLFYYLCVFISFIVLSLSQWILCTFAAIWNIIIIIFISNIFLVTFISHDWDMIRPHIRERVLQADMCVSVQESAPGRIGKDDRMRGEHMP